ncbi:MAG: hypothetical protein ACP5FK_07270 [bacterium]
MKPTEKVKIQVYCPKSHADEVRLAIGDAGGGVIGNYSHCAFVSEGKGYFLPQKGANPYLGEIGKIEQVEEVKIEFVCERHKVKSVVEAIRKAHPYDEIPIDIIPLSNLMN